MEKIDTIFYLTISMALPLIYATPFFNLQYSRERRLAEEYASKSNISISLIPYKDLVEKLVIKVILLKLKSSLRLLSSR